MFCAVRALDRHQLAVCRRGRARRTGPPGRSAARPGPGRASGGSRTGTARRRARRTQHLLPVRVSGRMGTSSGARSADPDVLLADVLQLQHGGAQRRRPPARSDPQDDLLQPDPGRPAPRRGGQLRPALARHGQRWADVQDDPVERRAAARRELGERLAHGGQRLQPHPRQQRQRHDLPGLVAHRGQVPHLGDREQPRVRRVVVRDAAEQLARPRPNAAAAARSSPAATAPGAWRSSGAGCGTSAPRRTRRPRAGGT